MIITTHYHLHIAPAFSLPADSCGIYGVFASPSMPSGGSCVHPGVERGERGVERGLGLELGGGGVWVGSFPRSP